MKKNMITVLIVGATLAGVYTLLKIVVWSRAEKTDIDEDNPYLDLNDSGRNSDGVDTETQIGRASCRERVFGLV